MDITALSLKYESELQTIKSILDLADTTPTTDLLILIAIDKAYTAILRYTGWETFDINYTSAVYSLAIAYFNNDLNRNSLANGKRSVTQESEGSRSRTYQNPVITIDSDGLTYDAKAILPLPKLKVL